MLTGFIDCNKTYVLPLENATEISSFLYILCYVLTIKYHLVVNV